MSVTQIYLPTLWHICATSFYEYWIIFDCLEHLPLIKEQKLLTVAFQGVQGVPKRFSGAARAPEVMIWNMGRKIPLHRESLRWNSPALYTVFDMRGKQWILTEQYNLIRCIHAYTSVFDKQDCNMRKKVRIDIFKLSTGRCQDLFISSEDWKICAHDDFMRKEKNLSKDWEFCVVILKALTIRPLPSLSSII